MKELLVRTLSGAVLVAVIVACIFISPWTCWALALFIVAIGTFELSRLMHLKSRWQMLCGELLAMGAFAAASLGMLGNGPVFSWLLLLPMLPFLLALFSRTDDFKSIAANDFGSVALLSLPCYFMVWLREIHSPKMLLLVFILLWANDTFAYLTGRLLGKHKLCVRISPGKTIEGSIGGLVFTLLGIMVYSHFADWLPMKVAIGMGLIAVVFGTLGDLCESMLKRQSGVKDSGRLIPGHGGILDRFDSVVFSMPFICVYLMMLS
ncbi:MAG: phosphatidate cytidylyltransferase [Bacteroidales bacterium]|nr:phosphatidate cytidylyltransferase [Bacteroidales bacterium]